MKYYSISASLGLTTTAAIFSVVSSQDKYDAVIVGAGWAGLRAVETLLDKGITNTLVLEAADHVGGRCWSKNSDGSENNPNLGENVIPFDLGPGFNYDSGINAQQDELWEEGFIPGKIWEDYEKYAVWPTWPGKATYYKQNGDGTATKRNNGPELMANIWAPFLKFRDDNLDDLFGQSYGETIEQYAEEEGLRNNDSLQFLNLIEDAKHLEYGTGDYDMDITKIEFTDATFHIETNYMGVPGLGWGNVAAKYGQQFASNIKRKAKVTEINAEDDEEYVTVTYVKNGSTRKVKARTVLVTVSIGVLQARNINFVPSLPNSKQRSIDATGFGVINKCLMSWNDPAAKIWPDGNEADKWFLMTTPDDDTTGKWTTFTNPSKYKGVPSLTAWIGGKDAIEAEKLSDTEILNDVMMNLNAMFPGIREPDNVVITRWGQEENVLGAYSFPSPGQAYYEDLENIKQRVGKIYFAGEATSGNGWATTFGAWDSGEEVATEMATKIKTLPPLTDEEEAPEQEEPEQEEPAATVANNQEPDAFKPVVTTEPTEPVPVTEEPEPAEPIETEYVMPPAPAPGTYDLPASDFYEASDEEDDDDDDDDTPLSVPSESMESTTSSSDEDSEADTETATTEETEDTDSTTEDTDSTTEDTDASSDEPSDSDADINTLQADDSSSGSLHSGTYVIASVAVTGLALSLVL